MHESSYIAEVSLEHRKEYGQYFTPTAVARLMADWVLKDHPKTILDPAFGLGVFYDATAPNGNQEILFTGYEIDPVIREYLSRRNGHHKHLKVIHKDYLEADHGCYDGILCNPPYMRFQKFLQRRDILPKIEKRIGIRLAGYSNIASVFLIKSLQELSPNGSLAYIMPFEFFNAGYGREIKKSLLANHLLKQIILFSNEREIFPDAITTVCVLLCKNDGREEPIKITLIHSLEELEQITDISCFYQHQIRGEDLPYSRKWSPLLLSLFSERRTPSDFCKLSLYGSVVRGIATGANEFFALSRSDLVKHNFGSDNYCKCITKSTQIRKSLFTEEDLTRLSNEDKPVYCLDVKIPEDSAVQAYLKKGECLEYHKRYLTRTRPIWYKIEQRKPAPILFGVFNRGRIKVVRNLTSAVNFTCFHGFYPNIYGEKLIDKLFIYFISDVGQEIIKDNKRSYGNNLDKFEPNDLNDSLVPSRDYFDRMDEGTVSKIMHMLAIDEKQAIQMSNDLMKKLFDV